MIWMCAWFCLAIPSEQIIFQDWLRSCVLLFLVAVLASPMELSKTELYHDNAKWNYMMIMQNGIT